MRTRPPATSRTTPEAAELRVLYYALGGGHGHVVRGLAVLRRLRTGILVLPARLAPWAETLGVEHVAVADPRDPAWIERLPVADLMLVDVFPRGVLGELTALPRMPMWLVTRRVATGYYLDPGVRAAIESRYERIVWTEEPPAPLTALRVPATRVPPVLLDIAPLDRDAARARLGVPEDRALVLALGAGEPERQARLRGLLAKITARADASLRFVSHELPATADTVALFPAAACLAAADVVVAAGGYHAVHEARRAGVPTVFVPQRRRYDDQAWRVRDEIVAVNPPELDAAIRGLLASGRDVQRWTGAGTGALARLVERRVELGVFPQEEIAAMA